MIKKDISAMPYRRQELPSVFPAKNIEDEVTVTVPAEDRIEWSSMILSILT